MQINLALLDATYIQLGELSEIVREKKFDRDIVLDKIKDVINNLKEINTLPEVDLDNYQKNIKSWNAKLAGSRKATNELVKYTTKIIALSNQISNDLNKKKGIGPVLEEKLDEVNQVLQHADEIEKAIVFDGRTELDGILYGYTHINFARKRRLWLWKSRIFFHSLYRTSDIIRVVLSAAAGFLAGIVGEKLFPKFPHVLLGIVVALISFFSLDTWLDKKAKEFFWREATREVFILYQHFKVYLDQINIIRGF
jgi:hypothetical protein